MPGMTLRLDGSDHDLLRILTIVKRKSANQIVIDLLRAEFDREMPGKRQVVGQPGTATQRLRDALGLPPLPDDPAAEALVRAKLDRAQADAERIYGTVYQDAA